ncbi:HNH endonuclease [Streptomyces filamentosus]|uniref:HNH endonuclease n=1 Tax=Streptomyces filamentosus TaxID=67294 RepID=UPI00331B6B8A
MWHLDPPSLSARESWKTCTSASRDTEKNENLGTRLRGAIGIAEAAAAAFRVAAESGTLHDLKPSDFKIGGIADDRVKDIAYISGMTQGAGRAIYDALMTAPEDELCPLCKHSDVSELDHVMPKDQYPALCVAPENLVPVCGICNKRKGNAAPDEAGKVLLHPYFEHLSTANWLQAIVIPDTQGRLKYTVSVPSGWGDVFTARVEHQFKFLYLGKRYSSRANQTLRGMRGFLADYLERKGADGIRAHLEELAASHLMDDPNGWKGVAYRSWAADPSFCSGSFQ